MFNRKIEVDFVKKKKGDLDEEVELDFEHKAVIVSRVIENSVVKVGFAICAYVILDTVRQVVVKSMTH